VRTFPAEERAVLEPQGIVSILVLPIVVGGRWWGFIGFDETRQPRVWKDAEVSLLKTAAEILGTFFTRKQYEKMLKESEKRYKSLFNSTNDGVCLHELIYEDSNPIDYRILDLNPKYEELTGIRRDHAIGALASHLYKSDNAPYLKICSEVTATATPTTFEAYFPPMEKHFLISVFSPSKDQFATVFQDITDRKSYEKEREKLISELTLALSEVKKLSGLLPICSHCKKIRDDKGYWTQIESYIHEHSEAEFSHGICQECAKKYYPDMDIYEE